MTSYSSSGMPSLVDEDDDEALMQRALELSMREMSTNNTNAVAAAPTSSTSSTAMAVADEEDEV